MKTFFSIFLLLISVFVFTAQAQTLQKAENLLANKSNSQWTFEENRGQLADENGVVLSDIKYYGKDKGVAIYLRQNKISFVFTKTEPKDKKPAFSEATGTAPFAFSPPHQKDFSEPEETTISTSRIDLELAGANKNAQIVAEEKISYYTNYYLAHTPEEGITHVPHYKKITYKNIYNNIDLVLHVKEQGVKYDFVVHPKGKVSDIKLLWNGTKPDVLQDGGIKYASALGEITESRPYSYVSENGNEVKSMFKVKGNEVRFEVGKYDDSKTLVIDPHLHWGTYYGGSMQDGCSEIVLDGSGNFYITGWTWSFNGLATDGAHQTNHTLAGYSDAFVAKFDKYGGRLWGTYYGGNENDESYNIEIDKNDDVYITGRTNSFSGIATTSAHQTVLGGDYDAFLAKFDNLGIRLWGTYYGGAGLDGGYGIALDRTGNIYISGYAYSASGIATTGVHQVSNAGRSDCFVAVFAKTGARQWGTYFGGPGYEGPNRITIDFSGNIFITGSTHSASGITTTGAHQVDFKGLSDVYLVKFNSNGVRQWSTYFGGSGSEDAMGICTDVSGNIYITGSTNSLSGIATSGAHQGIYGGRIADAFVAKFSGNGLLRWGTYYGGSGWDRGHCIKSNVNGNIYIVGDTQSPSGIATPGVHKDVLNDSINQVVPYDAFLAKFNSSGLLQWATYYGGNNDENAISIAVDSTGCIYIAGQTRSTSGIATHGTHENILQGNTDAFIAKFSELPLPNDAGIISINSPQGNTCGGNFAVQTRIKNFSSSMNLDSCKIGWSVNGIKQIEYNWQGALNPGDTSSIINIGSANFKGGKNILKIWTFDPNGGDDIDNSNDTLTQTIYFLPTPEAKTANDTFICIGESITIGAETVEGNLYNWTSNPPGFTSSQSKITLTPNITAIYYLKETDTTSGCAKEDSVKITVFPFPEAVIIGDTSICGKTTATYETKNNLGSTYTWEVEGGNIIAGQGNNSITIQIDKNTKTGKVKLKETNAGGCVTEKELTFNYQYSALTNLSPDKFICEGSSKLIKLDSADGNIYYRWYPDENDTEHFIIVRKVKNYFVVVNDGCNSTFQEEIKIFSGCPNSLIVYPNPAQQFIKIKYSLAENTDLKIGLYDRLGKDVLNIADGFYEQGVYEYQLDAAKHGLSSAIYVVRMLAGKEVFVKQFILVN